MNTNLMATELKPYIDDTVISVFDTMLAMELRPSSSGAFFRSRETQVIGMVGLAGSVTALICLRITESFSQQLAHAMLDVQNAEKLPDSDVNDVIGELANITAGKLKSCFRTPGLPPCSLSLPTIVRGHTIEMESISGTHRLSYTFRHDDEPIVVEFYSLNPEEK